MKPSPRADASALKTLLSKERPMQSLIEAEMATVTGTITRETANWVPMWVDQSHKITSDCGKITALRAITDQGELIWFVHHADKAHGYHANTDSSAEAIEEAHFAWSERRRVRKQWPMVQKLARDLVLGRRKMDVTIEDAYNSALCRMGTEGFLRKMRMPGIKRMSGRTAGLLMLIEPQMGFAIHRAYERQRAEMGAPAKGDIQSI
jgi:hypothetical protein